MHVSEYPTRDVARYRKPNREQKFQARVVFLLKAVTPVERVLERVLGATLSTTATILKGGPGTSRSSWSTDTASEIINVSTAVELHHWTE